MFIFLALLQVGVAINTHCLFAPYTRSVTRKHSLADLPDLVSHLNCSLSRSTNASEVSVVTA